MKGGSIDTTRPGTVCVMFEGLLAEAPKMSQKYRSLLLGLRWGPYIADHVMRPAVLAQCHRMKPRLDGPLDLVSFYDEEGVSRIRAIADAERWPFERVRSVSQRTLSDDAATGRLLRFYYGNDMAVDTWLKIALGRAAQHVDVEDSSWR